MHTHTYVYTHPQVAADRDAKRHNTLDVDAAQNGARDEEDTRIAKLTGTELMKAMDAGDLSSKRAVAAFSRRARSIGHITLRSVTEEFYDEAMTEAAAADARRDGRRGEGNQGVAKDGQLQEEVLLGMPVSIKDVMHMKGAVSGISVLSGFGRGSLCL